MLSGIEIFNFSVSDHLKCQTDSYHIIVGQKFSDVLLMYTCKLQCTFRRLTFSVTLDMVLNLPLNQQMSTSSVLELSAIETTPLFDVSFKWYIAEVED